ncbi:alpha/beta hydrolase [Dysgonamonadaceae bacterium]|nr:alpha/beta hydrolase [Dysgonamonadaceae bacterium]
MKTILLTFIAATTLSGCYLFGQNNLIPLDKDLSTVEYPYPVSFFGFHSQNQPMRMAYMDVKPENYNGKNIVLLHGKNFNGAYWQETISALAQKGYRVVVPDQVGFGKSTKPEHYQYSFHQLATNTKNLLDNLGLKKVSVLGHSMGGMLATRFALIFPETTEKLVLVNPIGLEDYQAQAAYQPIDEGYRNELKNTAESYKKYQLTFYYDNRWKPEYDRWLNLLAGWTLHPDYPLVAWNAALTSDMIFTQPVVHEFKNVKVPTLLIIGTRDRTAIGKDRAPKEVQPTMGLYNELGRKTKQQIPNAQLVELDDVGHLPHIEAFDRFITPLLKFLGE